MQRGQHKKCWLLSNHGSKKNCIFDLKFCIVLCYTYETPIFRLRWTQLTWIINPSYPEVTLDTFRFLVDGRLAAWLAVSWPQLPKVALFGPNNAVLWPEINFFVASLKKVVIMVPGHLKDNQFVLTALQGVREAVQVLFRPKIGPKF